MIREMKRWMCYHYYDRKPGFHFRTTHLFSPVRKKIPGMVCIPFSTMKTDVRECDFLSTWSKSTRYKINKAEGENLSVRRSTDILPDILNLFRQTADAKKLRGHHEDDFTSRPWILCSAVYHEEKIIAGHVWLIDEEEKTSLLFVNAAAHHDPDSEASLVSRAHYYLLYQDGMHLRNHGIDFLDLNGYDPKKSDPSLSGVYRWKEGTHGRHEELYHYYPIWFYLLRKIRRK